MNISKARFGLAFALPALFLLAPEFLVAQDKSAQSDQPKAGALAPFGIPLDAPLGQVVAVLDKCTTSINGLVSESGWELRHHRIRDAIGRACSDLSSTEKEEAMTRFDSKIRFHTCTYKEQNQYLYPDSLNRLARIWPLAANHFEVCNSEFFLECDALPEMKANGFSKCYIYFSSFDQEEPKSFMVCLCGGRSLFDDEKAARDATFMATLQKKYGMPRIYYPVSSKEDEDLKNWDPSMAEGLKFLKGHLSPIDEHAPEASQFQLNAVTAQKEDNPRMGDTFKGAITNYNMLYMLTLDMSNPVAHLDAEEVSSAIGPFQVIKQVNGLRPLQYNGPPRTWFQFVLEYKSGDSSVLLPFSNVMDHGDFAINYVFWPHFYKLANSWNEMLQESEQALKKRKEDSKAGF